MPNWLKTYLSGVLMGAADVIPGVSGGTIAFIVGIYDRLISALSGVNKASLVMLARGDFRALWRHFDGGFLVLLLAGIATSIFSIAHIVTDLLHNYPVWLWSFFFGLILASSYILIQEIKGFSWRHMWVLMVGAAIGASLSLLVPTQVSTSTFMVLLSGMIAICAMILPGISGSFILLMMGMYGFIIGAVKSLDILTIAVFAVGALVGLLSFSKLLHWLLEHAKSITLSLLTGVMFGALVKVWPWKETLSYIHVGNKTLPAKEALLWPWHMEAFEVISGLLIPCGLIILGGAVVLGAHYISLQKNKFTAKKC